MSDERRRTVRVRISGRVQGVFYRAWAFAEAERLGVDGWVRNRRDGTVEAVFSGTAAAVGEMVERCHQGPPAALVSGIDISDEPLSVVAGFRARPTV